MYKKVTFKTRVGICMEVGEEVYMTDEQISQHRISNLVEMSKDTFDDKKIKGGK